MARGISNPNAPTEFHWARLFEETGFTKVEELYRGILPTLKDFCEQEHAEIVRSLPTVQPCVRRRRRPQLDKITADDTISATVPEAAVVRNHPNVDDAVRPVPGASGDASAAVPNIPGTFCSAEVPISTAVTGLAENTDPNILDASCPEEDVDPSHTTFHLPKSTYDCQSSSVEMASRVVVLNLKDTNLARHVRPLLRRYTAGPETAVKIAERNRESTEDSGVASGEEEDFVPPLKIRIVRTAVPSVESRDHGKEAKAKRRKRSSDAPVLQERRCHQEGSHPRNRQTSYEAMAPQYPIQPSNHRHGAETEEAPHSRLHPSGDAKATPRSKKNPSKTNVSRPKIPVSILLTEPIRSAMDGIVKRRCLDDFTDQKLVNKTALPSDVIPTAEFNLDSIQMTPLATRRYKEPVPLQFAAFSEVKNVCIPCNKLFSSKQQLASHQLTEHPSALNY